MKHWQLAGLLDGSSWQGILILTIATRPMLVSAPQHTDSSANAFFAGSVTPAA
jgi:hypothetical protein